jgi:NTE family protein
MSRPRVGLVLSGGGARGAYEVGVMRYIRERLGFNAEFDVITGTSVGAINGAYIAATCDRPRAQARLLQKVWLDLNIDDVYSFGWQQLRELPRVLFGRDLPRSPHGSRVGGLIDTTFLEKVVRDLIPWHGISRNLRDGRLSALACTATEVATGASTVFVQTRSGQPHWPRRRDENVVQTSITSAHTLASAAIPILFPSIRVGDQFFVDGSLRQNTPLRPAMRLGAERLIVVGLRHQHSREHLQRRLRRQAQFTYPNAMFLMGKMLNALMIDRVEADIERIERTNRLITAGTEAFGPEFQHKISEGLGRERDYAEISHVMIRPSEDLGKIAADVVRATGLAKTSGVMARFIRRAVEADDPQSESDLASYVLFDRAYLSALIDLGFEDAAKKREQILRLFDH